MQFQAWESVEALVGGSEAQEPRSVESERERVVFVPSRVFPLLLVAGFPPGKSEYLCEGLSAFLLNSFCEAFSKSLSEDAGVARGRYARFDGKLGECAARFVANAYPRLPFLLFRRFSAAGGAKVRKLARLEAAEGQREA